MTFRTLKECGQLGRKDGLKQKASTADEMRFKFEFQTQEHWIAYVRGFYRALGYPLYLTRGRLDISK